MRTGRRRGKTIIFVFLAPAILFYTVFFVYPAADAFRVSTWRWKGVSFENVEHVGLANFREALNDKWVKLAFTNNILIMIGGGALLLALALFLAVVLTREGFRGASFFKTIIFSPYAISSVGIALLWGFIYDPRFGLLNEFLRAIGLEALAKPWMARRETAWPALILVIVWSAVGFFMMLFIAGIQGIPSDYYGAARVDGANEWQLFRHVTIPLLREVLTIAIVYWMIAALRVFGIIWAMTRGGPAHVTQTVTTYFYHLSLYGESRIFRMGYGTSIAVLLFLVILILSIVYLRLTRREAIEY